MKSVFTATLLMIAILGKQTLFAQTVDDIVNKHIDAMGGRDKLLTLHTVKMQGSLSIQGTDVAIIITKKHLAGMRIDIFVMGTENYQVVTTSKGISFMPLQGMDSPTEIPDDQFKALQPQLDVQDVLLDYKAKSTTVELIGTEKVDGEDCYKLKVTFSNGFVINYFISTNTFYVVKASSNRLLNGESVDFTTNYSNYKQNADGFWFPYTITNMQGTTDYSQIDTNIPVDDSIFNP